MRLAQDALPNQLGCHEALGLVSDVVRGIESRGLRQSGEHGVQQPVQVGALGRRCRDEFVELVHLAAAIEQREQRLLAGKPIDLVHQQERRGR